MDPLSDPELAAQLKLWFQKHKNDPHKWTRTKTGKLIRDVLIYWKHWKNKPRGNPKRAHAEMMRKIHGN